MNVAGTDMKYVEKTWIRSVCSLVRYKGKDNVHSITGHQGPRGGVEL
jgi:hypothetical protein